MDVEEILRNADNELIAASGAEPEIRRVAKQFIEHVLMERPVNVVNLDDEISELIATQDDWLLDVTKQFILQDERVVQRELTEIERDGLEDPIFPNEWIYHKNMPIDKVRKYILDLYDGFRLTDQDEKED